MFSFKIRWRSCDARSSGCACSTQIADLARCVLIREDRAIDWICKSVDLRQLRYFVVLAEELHFRRAAERLNITQAPLSVAIQTLEREFGAQLFHRTQRHVALTEIGAVFRDHALSILERVERSLANVRQMVSGEAGQLRIGFAAAAALLSFFPEIICAFRNKYPKVQVTLLDIPSIGQISALQNREIDIGIVRGFNIKRPADISFTKLIVDRLVVPIPIANTLTRLP